MSKATLRRRTPITESSIARMGPGHPNTSAGHHVGIVFTTAASAVLQLTHRTDFRNGDRWVCGCPYEHPQQREVSLEVAETRIGALLVEGTVD